MTKIRLNDLSELTDCLWFNGLVCQSEKLLNFIFFVCFWSGKVQGTKVWLSLQVQGSKSAFKNMKILSFCNSLLTFGLLTPRHCVKAIIQRVLLCHLQAFFAWIIWHKPNKGFLNSQYLSKDWQKMAQKRFFTKRDLP